MVSSEIKNRDKIANSISYLNKYEYHLFKKMELHGP